MKHATGAAAALAFALALASASPSKGRAETWVSVIEQDERTTSSEIIDEETRTTLGRRGGAKPFQVKQKTEGSCEVEAGGYLHNPFAKDRWDGFWYEIYLVSPPSPESHSRKWRRIFTGDGVCISPPILTPASGMDTFRRRVAELVVLPPPTIAISPRADGITGLPVQLWAEGVPDGWLSFPPTVLDGKRIEVQARPTEFLWDTGDAGTRAAQHAYAATAPGNAGSPSVTHVYETKSSEARPDDGTYRITLDVTWDRRYRVVGLPDPCTEWCALDPGRTSTSMPYRVVEVRGALVP